MEMVQKINVERKRCTRRRLQKENLYNGLDAARPVQGKRCRETCTRETCTRETCIRETYKRKCTAHKTSTQPYDLRSLIAPLHLRLAVTFMLLDVVECVAVALHMRCPISYVTRWSGTRPARTTTSVTRTRTGTRSRRPWSSKRARARIGCGQGRGHLTCRAPCRSQLHLGDRA